MQKYIGREREVLKNSWKHYIQMRAVKNVLERSNTTRNTVLRTELGTYPLKTNRDVRNLNVPSKDGRL